MMPLRMNRASPMEIIIRVAEVARRVRMGAQMIFSLSKAAPIVAIAPITMAIQMLIPKALASRVIYAPNVMKSP